MSDTAEPSARDGCIATILRDGREEAVTVALGQTILDAAEAQGLELPHGCRSASCGHCRARLAQGEAEMTINFALDEKEIAAGQILLCEARPLTPTVRIEYD